MDYAIEEKPVSIFIPYALLAISLMWVFVQFVQRVDPEPGMTEFPEESFISPSFELPTLQGSKVKLSDYRGKVVFINFWATWCATCEVEMPSMQKLYDKFKDRGFEMLTISVDKDPEKIPAFLKKYNLSFPVLLDPEENVAKKDYKTTGVPETFIVDQHGIIRHKAVGPRDWATDEIIQSFEMLINEEI